MPKRWNFGREIVVPIMIFTVLAVLLGCAGLAWTTKQADEISIERQVRTTEHAISLSIDELAKEQETVAVWDDPIIQLQSTKPDWQWFDDNLGVWLYDLFGHHRVFILDPMDKPVYSMVDGERALPARYGEVAADLQLMVDSVRGRVHPGNGLHDRNPLEKPNARATLLTTDRAVHDTHLMLVAGRPAATSVMRFVPLTDKLKLAKGDEHLLVSVRFLDAGFLQALATRNLIESPRYSRRSNNAEGEHALPLITEHGEAIGFLIWRPELPGSRLLRTLGPQTLVSLLILIGGMVALGLRLWESMKDLQEIHRRLKGTVVELKASEAQAHHLAFHDVLTGLPNRSLFNDRLDQALSRARRGGRVALLALDLDRFKQVNDTLGHHAGDALIREVAARLALSVREHDTVARLSGDEFAIILNGLDQHAVVDVCERILEALRRPFDLSGAHAFVGVSIGIVYAPAAGEDRSDLLRKADIALYRAKQDGRDCFREFTSEMDATVKRRREIEQDLRVALDTGTGLCLHYQPQVSGPEQQITGFEALVRWDHPTRGRMSPEQFIPVAEETGLIRQVGYWLLHEACETAKCYPGLFMAINLSPVQFRIDGFAERIIEIVRQSGADPRQIELEVTENVLLDDDEQVVEALRTLRAAGLRIALDDFGTGYSSLSYLRRFEVDKIKIDKSFIQHLGQNADSVAIVTAIVTLGHAMGLTVTAEGVETAEQQQFLAAMGCNVLQGFLYSRALPSHCLPELTAAPQDWSSSMGGDSAKAA